MIIIVEGPDGAGKSTLAAYLNARYGATVIHTGPPKPDEPAFLQYMDKVQYYMNIHGGNVVMDRFHLGERVYGPILRGHDTLGDAGQRLVESRLMSRNFSCVVMCIPPFETCLKNWKARHDTELFTEYETFVKTYTAFKDIRTRLPRIDFDYTASPLSAVADAIDQARPQ